MVAEADHRRAVIVVVATRAAFPPATAIAIAVGKPREWVDDLDADDAVLLASTVIEVNADFFTRQVMPRLSALFAQVGDATSPGGSTPPSP